MIFGRQDRTLVTVELPSLERPEIVILKGWITKNGTRDSWRVTQYLKVVSQLIISQSGVFLMEVAGQRASGAFLMTQRESFRMQMYT